MEPHTNSSTPVSTPAREPSPILDGRRHGYHWVVIMVAASAFRFRVYDAYDEPVFVDADDYPHAGKAATAAEKWCEQEHAATGGNSEPANEQARSTFSVTTVGGWMLQPVDDRAGTYKVEVVNAETGEFGPEEFTGYIAWGDALADAVAWAKANPCDGSAAGEAPASVGEAEVEPAWSAPEVVEHELAVATAADARGTDLALGSHPAALEPASAPDDAHAEGAADAVTTSPTPTGQVSEVEALRRELAALRRAAALERSDLDELAEDARRSQALAREIAGLEGSIKDLRDVKKGKEAELAILTGKTANAVVSLHDGRSPKPYQRKITFAESPETRAQVGAEAAQVATELDAGTSTPAEAAPVVDTWSFNGVEHRVERRVEQTADGERWTTWLKGHKDKTEEHGFTFEQALEATKTTASVVFADAEPGSTAASPDAGPLADGPRTPAKRGRKPKLGKHDQAAVIAVVERHLTLPEAAMDLGCTPQQLEGYAEKAGLVLSKHQGRSAGEELPAPLLAKASKPRGRKGPRS